MNRAVFHGGRIKATAIKFGLSSDSILDFSSNLNPYAPLPDEAIRQAMVAAISNYPEPDAPAFNERLAEASGIQAKHLLPFSFQSRI